MPRKRRKTSVNEPGSAEHTFLRLQEIEDSAAQALRSLRSLLVTARDFSTRSDRPFTSEELPVFARFGHEYSVLVKPGHRLVAEYVAVGETDHWVDARSNDLDFFEELLTGRRLSVVILSRRRHASAFRAARLLTREAYPEGEDRFGIEPLLTLFRGLVSTRRELGVILNPGAATPERSEQPVLLRDCYRLSLALACGLARIAVPSKSWLTPEHRLLAELVSKDKSLTALIRSVNLKAIAAHLADLASPEDMDIVREELRLEFAAVTSRLPDFMAHVAALKELWGDSERNRAEYKPGADPRSEYAYTLVSNTKMTLAKALGEFNARAKNEGWIKIASVQGLRSAALSYAERFDKEPPPRRRRD